MTSMTQFYELMQLSLRDVRKRAEGIRCLSKTPSENEWQQLYEQSQKQAVAGVAFGALDGLSRQEQKPPLELLYQWIGEAEQIKAQNRNVNKAVEALARLLDDNDIRYAVVKGQIAAKYYLHPELRMSGDVDFYVTAKDVEVTRTLICEKWKVEMEKGDSPYHYHFDKNGVTFEMHFRLLQMYQRKRDDYWQELQDGALGHRVKIGDTMVATLNPTIHTLYVFLHLYNHLVEVGVGLRQFCDLAMLLKEGIDRKELKLYLEALGMARAFRACEYILKECLGVPEKYLPYRIESSDVKYGRRMLGVVLYRGNMGHYNKRNGWSGLGHQLESAGIKISHFAKFFWLSPGYHLGWMKRRLATPS